jgi:hypothetical protein
LGFGVLRQLPRHCEEQQWVFIAVSAKQQRVFIPVIARPVGAVCEAGPEQSIHEISLHDLTVNPTEKIASSPHAPISAAPRNDGDKDPHSRR